MNAAIRQPLRRAAIICRGLVKRYKDVEAVRGLDLEVLTGECFGLLGPNGAGKTTTVEILEGLRRSHFFLAFVMLRALFLLFELPLLFGAAYFIFGVKIRGSIALLAALSLLGAFVFAGMGLLVSSRTPNTQTANGLINLISMPLYIFSGVFFSHHSLSRLRATPPPPSAAHGAQRCAEGGHERRRDALTSGSADDGAVALGRSFVRFGSTHFLLALNSC